MSYEDDIARELQARAASLRASPDLADLSARLQRVAVRAEHRDRLVIGGAALALALALGGLAGALATRPAGTEPVASPSAGVVGGNIRPDHANAHRERGRSTRRPATELRLSVSGVSLLAIGRSLPSPVAVTTQWSSAVSCNRAVLVTTTVGRSGAFAGASGIIGLPALAPWGLEVVDSGVLPTQTGGEVWWLTAAAGSAVARVAAEGPGGQVVTAQPRDGLALLAGSQVASSAGITDISAVAEDSQGQSLASLAVVMGSGPKVAGEQPASSEGGSGTSGTPAPSACAVLPLPPLPDSATSSQPGDPRLAAAAVVAAYEAIFQHAMAQGPLSGDSGTVGETLPAVAVRQVSFVSATRAEVVYRMHAGLWQTGTAVLGAAGRWTPQGPPKGSAS
jgi:hypothetical protein